MRVSETEAESCFIDTNIWLYALLEGDDPEKSTRAKSLIETQSIVTVSTQVINEVCVNLTRRAKFSEQQVQQLIESFYAKCFVVELSKPLLLKASALRERYTLSFWDSAIVSSALSADVSVLYSEDGLVVENRLRILNPFKDLAQSIGGGS
jgi:predicted nucleic acid-binding protein